MRLFLFVVFFIASTLCTQAQRTCATKPASMAPRLYGDGTSIDNGVQRDTLPDEVITIPVVVHLLYNSADQNLGDEQILSQIEALNNDFRMLNVDQANVPDAFAFKAADARIKFCLAQIDPGGKPTSGIIRKYTTKAYFMGDDGMKFTNAGGDNIWDPKQYLNIWVCKMFGRSLGYATMPGTPLDKDGVVISYDVFGTTANVEAPFNKGRTTTHEVAHWLGLKHIWGDDVCGNDEVDDTPPQKSYNFNCPIFPSLSSCSENEKGDMFMNFMDLTDDACMNMFTHGQKTKMRSLFAINGYRNSFLSSFGCDSTLNAGGPASPEPAIAEKPKPAISAYPNPVEQILTVLPTNDYNLEGKSATVYNLLGKIVYQTKFQSQKGQVNLSFLLPGLYYLQVGDGTNKIIQRLIKI